MTYFVNTGVGFGSMYVCTFIMVNHYFDKYRSLATGIATCGSGIGMFIFAPLSLLLIETFAWKGAMLIIAGISLNCFVLGATFKNGPQSALTDDDTEQPRLFAWELLRNPVFVLFWSSSIIVGTGEVHSLT